MKLCVISFKPCWREPDGRWMSSGGFPLQMDAIGSLFDQMTLLVVEVERGQGGIPLPAIARVIPMHQPAGADTRRKLSVMARFPYYFRMMRRHCREADVVHVPLPGDLSLLGMLTAVTLRKRLLARYGGSWNPNARTTRMNRVTRAWMRRLAGGRNVMLATGGGAEPPAPGMFWVFSTALSDEELARNNADLNRGLSAPPRLVYVGRLSPEKGVANLIRALAQLHNSSFDPMPMLALAGDGPKRAALEGLASDLNLKNRILFLGQLDRPGLSGVLQQSDLCVQPSLTEGFSKAWLDAMAYGLPVVVSDVGAAAGVVGRNRERGWLVTPDNVAELADTLKQILVEVLDWPAMRRRCRQFVEGRTLEAWAERIGSLCAEQWGLDLVEGKLR